MGANINLIRKDTIPPDDEPLTMSRASFATMKGWDGRLRHRRPTVTVVAQRPVHQRTAGNTATTLNLEYALDGGAVVLGRSEITGEITLWGPFSTIEDFEPHMDRLFTIYGGDEDRFVADPDNLSRNFAHKECVFRHEMMHYHSYRLAAQHYLWESFRGDLASIVTEFGPLTELTFTNASRVRWGTWQKETELRVISHDRIMQFELRNLIEEYRRQILLEP